MRRFSVLCFLIFASEIFFSCTSTEYIKTGNEFSPLADNYEVAVFTSKPEQKYQAIGLARIRGGNLDSRIEKAKRYAREKGGNAIIVRETGVLTEPGTDNVKEKIESSTYETQEFLIIRVEDNKADNKMERLEELKDDTKTPAEINTGTSKTVVPKDYASIPRASYKQLINNYESLNGKVFRGTLYPRKIYKIPASLEKYTQNGDRIILLSTISGKYKLYLLVDKQNLPALRNKVKSGEKLDFLYTPLTVFTNKDGTFPVIKFNEEIVEKTAEQPAVKG